MKTQITHLLSSFLLVISLIFSQSIFSQTLALEENFDFVAGSTVSGQNSWTVGTASTNRVVVSDAGLTYPDYPNASVGKGASFVPTSDRIQKNFDGSLTGTYYYSFLINASTAGTGDYFIGFFSSSAFRGRTYIKADGTGFQFGLTKTTTGPVVYTSGIPYVFGTTYCVVVKYEFQTGSGTDDKVSLYVNPDFKAADLPATATIGPLMDAGNDVGASVFALQGRANSGSFILDGVRVAPNWGSIKGEAVLNHFLEVPKSTSSHMVLQRETPLKFNGWGAAGDSVKVVFNREGTRFADSVKIDADGRWKIQLPSQLVCTTACTLSFELLHQAGSTQSFDDILVGDVWLAGGQSNMEKKVSHMLEAADYIAQADNYPMIRSFRASYFDNPTPQERVNGSSGSWYVCNSAVVGDNVSAVAYVFARNLNIDLQVPIGIVQSYRGGTELETWMSNQKITTDPDLCKVQGRIASMSPTNMANYPSIHFNGQINPLINIPLKGFLFYQGESNTKRALEYRFMMKKLIEDWRSLWGMGNLPFYYVQLPNMGPTVNQEYEEGNWQDLREQQALLITADNVPNIGMAVIIDTNEDPNNADELIRIHPKNKKPVGDRLALIALKNTYNKNIIAESPMVSSYSFVNDSAVIVFKNIGTGLKIKTGDTILKGFVLAASDKQFNSATATILNDSTIILKSAFVSQPVSARYGWAKNPICNLYNSAELPASPYRTDSWASGFVYDTFASTCNNSADANLLTILLNGRKLNDFSANTLSYDLVVSTLPQVNAYTNFPFASVIISQPTESNGRKAIITVTAENASTKSYEINFSKTTGINGIMNDKIKIYQKESKLIIETKDNLQGKITIFNFAGQCVHRGIFRNNIQNEYQLNQTGIYIVNLSTLKEDIKMKFILR